LNVQEGEKVCDLGSGYGSNDVLLSLAGAQTYAVDVDTDTLRLGKNNADLLQVDVNYCIADLNKTIGFKSKSFDKALSCCVLEHLSNPEGFLSEVNRILDSKGILAISVDSFSYHNISDGLRVIHKRMCDVKRYYTKREAELMLNRCGFSVKKCSFIIRSPISSFLFETLLRMYFRSELYRQSFPLKLFKLLTPMVLIVCMISDGFYDDSRGGWWLTLLASKEA
jgi:ubiquinone/menaquinone biosynthesis C-methylase UbiE